MLRFIVLVAFFAVGTRAELMAPHADRGELEVGQIVTRCAFDIGGGSTKIKVARVDLAQQKIVNVLFESELKVPYKASLTKQNEAPETTLADGARAIIELREQARKGIAGDSKRALASGALGCRAVAGSPFREMINRTAAVEQLSRISGVPIVIVSHDEEAILGLLGAIASASQVLRKDIAPLDLIVWDIGGANMQLTVLKPGAKADTSGRFIIHKEAMASETFKRYLIEKIQGKPEGTKSPNPISVQDMEAGLKFARASAASVSGEIRARLQVPGATVVGIGPVHGKSIAGQTNAFDGSPITAEKIRQTLKERLNWTDEKVGGPYADTQVANLILVLGYMEQLKVTEVNALDITLNEGQLVNSRYWEGAGT